jgi:hypothetical protein
MQVFMAASAKDNQVRVVIVALLAAQLFVMDLEISPRTADLASPAVTAQYLFSELFITLGTEPHARSSGIGNPAGPTHIIEDVILSRDELSRDENRYAGTLPRLHVIRQTQGSHTSSV